MDRLVILDDFGQASGPARLYARGHLRSNFTVSNLEQIWRVVVCHSLVLSFRTRHRHIVASTLSSTRKRYGESPTGDVVERIQL
jgi:hypothetical protein